CWPFARAMNVISPEPSLSVARNLKIAVCSRPSAICNVCDAPPAIDRRSLVCARSSISAFGPEPSTLLATVTPASNSSPGAASTGTLGVITNSPPTRASASPRRTAIATPSNSHDLQRAIEIIGHVINDFTLGVIGVDDARPKDDWLFRDALEGIQPLNVTATAERRH